MVSAESVLGCFSYFGNLGGWFGSSQCRGSHVGVPKSSFKFYSTELIQQTRPSTWIGKKLHLGFFSGNPIKRRVVFCVADGFLIAATCKSHNTSQRLLLECDHPSEGGSKVIRFAPSSNPQGTSHVPSVKCFEIKKRNTMKKKQKNKIIPSLNTRNEASSISRGACGLVCYTRLTDRKIDHRSF
ncbi:hypothetical protein CDAR_197421 [Caerostris darwini]|uniref:Uncharacterized protein n=1 Tax=Caerostris darwini TaxID=1538125 RepID=A0AAV4UUW5_9ARAC|nr:hypothetical protein CDAR_197421 [Caerostris darwini]